MGFIEMRAYATKQGNSTMYLTCPAESKKSINTLWELITQHRTMSREHLDMLFSEIEMAITRIQGPL